ncbi:glycosyltransferase family 2 protein [Chryseobacterium sp. VAUSW3]|uniref:glycosyltransferase family 2 protein n=1 Tax=Chryseobacterium sp. VAUSW3 TaxID=2010998 RepID=UPI000B4D50C9|nr:glycosyltransferase family 2 protein [Chryseobacterium sp. VAUSW3]OWR15752.1 glycosyl transferase [Chryseobacterium sp. VAUSW3]
MGMNKLAIVIPYYKMVFFEETLKSVASQTDKRFTLYIGNDASPDDPFPLIDKYFPDGSYNYIDYKENLGGKNLAMQWERILENVTEEWFHILGDDDVISENFVEEFYKDMPVIIQKECNVVKFSQCWINENGERITDFTDYEQLIDPADNIGYKIMKAERSSLSEHIFRKKQYLKFNFKKFPLAWATDDVAVLEFSERKYIYFIRNSKVLVRVSNENISGRTDNQLEKKNAKIASEKYLIKKHYKNLTKESLIKIINNQIYYRYHFNTPLGFSLFKMYYYLRLYKKILALPKTYLILCKILK